MENKPPSERSQELVDRTFTKFQLLSQAVQRSRQGVGTAEDTMLILKHNKLAEIMARFKSPSKAPKKR